MAPPVAEAMCHFYQQRFNRNTNLSIDDLTVLVTFAEEVSTQLFKLSDAPTEALSDVAAVPSSAQLASRGTVVIPLVHFHTFMSYFRPHPPCPSLPHISSEALMLPSLIHERQSTLPRGSNLPSPAMPECRGAILCPCRRFCAHDQPVAQGWHHCA